MHRIYLKRYFMFALSLALFAGSVYLFLQNQDEDVFKIITIPLGAINIFDLFYIPHMVKDYNLKLAVKLGLDSVPQK